MYILLMLLEYFQHFILAWNLIQFTTGVWQSWENKTAKVLHYWQKELQF